MEPIEHIRRNFPDSIRTTQQALETVAPSIARAATMLARALSSGARVLCCGNGGPAADARHFSSELLNHFERERPGLPGIALCGRDSGGTLPCCRRARKFAYRDLPQRASRKYIYWPFTASVI